MDDASSSDSEEEVDSEKKLSSIFNDAHATTFLTDDGKKRWRCEWCKKDFAAWNATKALYHLTKKKKVDIAPCQARIDQASMARYVGLLQKKKEKSDRITRKRDLVENSINSKNDRAAVSLESSKRRKKNSSNASFSSTIKSSTKGDSPGCVHTGNIFSTPGSTATKHQDLVQMKIYGGPTPNADTKLVMAIADFIHSCGLPFRIADHPKFRKMITMMYFCMPIRKV